jgi:hypothetical protein
MNKYLKSTDKLEREFDAFFNQGGYSRLSEIVGDSPAFSNADYVNTSEKVLVELKILDKDYFKEGGIIDRFHGFVAAPTNIDNRGVGTYVVTFPDKNREGKHDAFEEPLRRVLKKGNRQLKESKRYLFAGEGTGIIVLAANGFSSLHPESLYRMIQELLSEEFDHIIGMILLFPTWALYDKDGELMHPLCYMSCLENSSDEQINLVCTLCEQWLEFMSQGGHAPPLVM